MFSQGAGQATRSRSSCRLREPPCQRWQPDSLMQALRRGAVKLRPGLEGVSIDPGIGGEPRKAALASAPSASPAVTETPTGGGPTKSGRALSSQNSPAGRGRPDPGSYSLTLPTVLTVFSVVARIRMTLFPARPSRLNVISMPNARRNVCARAPARRRSAALTVAALGDNLPHPAATGEGSCAGFALCQ